MTRSTLGAGGGEGMMAHHKWELSNYTTNSGKCLYYCPVCGEYSPAPVKPELDNSCESDKFKDWYYIENNKVYTKPENFLKGTIRCD
jgi:hypothetical protein